MELLIAMMCGAGGVLVGYAISTWAIDAIIARRRRKR